jgi:hypothetical protein
VSTKKYTPKSDKVRSDEEALDVASGGPLTTEQPYSEAKHSHRGEGDVSGWPNAAVFMTAEGHQADADKAVASKASEHMERRGPRKGLK